MGKKAVSGIMLILLTISIVSLAANVKPVKSEWTGTVYIRADGSIDPPDAPIITYDNVTYMLTDNITSSGDGIVVERDNIIIDGAGYTLEGTGSGTGIDLTGRSNVTIKNMEIKAFNWEGILLHDSSNNSIIGNSITANNDYGIRLSDSPNNTISGNTIANNGYGIYLSDFSNNNIICGNSITNNLAGLWIGYGIYLEYSFNNTIIGNRVTNNDHGIYLSESSNNVIYGNNITNNDSGVLLYYSSNNDIKRNNISANNQNGLWIGYGIYLYGSSNNTISENNVTSNDAGVYLVYSLSNKLYHNNFIDNTQQVHIEVSDYANFWDDGYPSGGNYWSDYTGTDSNGDGIGDSPYTIDENNVDRYPLMGPFNSFNTSIGCSVDVISNSTIEDFRYFESNGTIIMHVSNMTANQAFGFCRLTIPHDVMSPPYTVKINGTKIEYEIIYENYTEGISIIYFTYEHSKLEIVITPEFPSITTLLLMLMVISIIVSVKRKVLRRKFPT